MSKKVIKLELSEEGLNRAIRELENYKKDFIKKFNEFKELVAERIAQEAKSGFNGAIVDDIISGDSPRQASVDVSIDNRGEITVVVASGEDAVWVEFGAGVYHNTAPGTSPHPRGKELGFTIGSYGKGKGKQPAWGYYDEGQLVLTRGTQAVMPLNKAMITICDDIASIAKEVFG